MPAANDMRAIIELAIAIPAVLAAFPAFYLFAGRIDRKARESLQKERPFPTDRAARPLDSPADLFAPPGIIDRIGLVLVHGIGEQTRFEHLSGQLRELLHALTIQKAIGTVQDVTVEIAGSTGAALHAEQDSWAGGHQASVVVLVHHRMGPGAAPRQARIFVHEVWWADVNERYSLAKQVRFWLWGMAIWAHPARMRSALGSASDVRPPRVPTPTLRYDRFRLWLAGSFFVLFGLSAGLVLAFVARVFRIQLPRFVRTMVNYLSAIKLYNQERRFGSGLLPDRDDFLDTLNEPPRASVRRRMIRTIADVACSRYHRWYVLAHSLGTVVAFNGLMETAYAWPGYLDERRWRQLRSRRMAGPARANWTPPPAEQRVVPKRPAWAGKRDIVYRDRIFRRCAGWLTYGSPLEKFAGIWPALVPISKEPAFGPHARWLNVYDELDPVSGRLSAFVGSPPACCPSPVEHGYSSIGPLLVTHNHYLTPRDGARDVSTGTLSWMLSGSPVPLAPAGVPPWYAPESETEKERRGQAWITWIAVTAGCLVLAGWLLPWLARLLAKAAVAL